jgi:hypothetical protein
MERVAELAEPGFEGAGVISGRDSSLFAVECSAGGVSDCLPAAAREVALFRVTGGAGDVVASGCAGFRKLLRRFSIGAYPAVSPRIKLIATNKPPNAAN